MKLMLRGLIVYAAVIFAVRIMGKRQIGELQPGELVVTIILSEVAAIPLEDEGIPILPSLALVFLFAALELLSSHLSMTVRGYRTMLQGHSVLVIKDGKIQQENLKQIRFSADDLLEALRLKDVFNIADVSYAYVETNGAISVQLKNAQRPPTASELDLKTQGDSIPCLVICDGKTVEREFALCDMTQDKLDKELKKRGLKQEDILLMTADSSGNIYCAVKEGKK